MRYNIDSDGNITAFGAMPELPFEVEENAPVTMNNFFLYKRVGNEWVLKEITE